MKTVTVKCRVYQIGKLYRSLDTSEVGYLGDLPAWRHMDKDKHKKYWNDEYERTLTRLRNRQPLDEAPPPRKAIENNRTPINKQKAVSELQRMRSELK